MQDSHFDTSANRNPSMWWFALPIGVGIFLRLYLLHDQILIDDEWHGLAFVIDRSFSDIFFRFSYPPNTVLNLYFNFLLNTLGWSELFIKLPSILFGCMSLFLFPILVNRRFGNTVALYFAWLLSISPFLIFYSRMARPYSMTVFFAFTAIMCGYSWLVSERKLHRNIYVFSCVAAIYCHFFASIAVLTPLAIGFVARLMQHHSRFSASRERIVPKLIDMTVVGLIIGALLLLLMVYPLIDFLFNDLNRLLHSGVFSLGTIKGILSLLSGSANVPLTLCFLALFCSGLISLFRRYPILSTTFCSVLVFYFITLFITHSDSIHAPNVSARYMIPVFPITYVLVALGLHNFAGFVESTITNSKMNRYNILSIAVSASFIAILFLAGPIPGNYQAPNNFTNHSAFQESYGPLDWNRSYVSHIMPNYYHMKKEDIPQFYLDLAENAEIDTIIEYPMMLGCHYNMYYYYQYFHQKRVLAGYVTTLEHQENRPTRNIFGDMTIDQVFSRIEDQTRLNFRNMVDLTDPASVVANRADYAILHRDLHAEMFPHLVFSIDTTVVPTPDLISAFAERFGPPVYEDEDITVFRLSQQ